MRIGLRLVLVRVPVFASFFIGVFPEKQKAVRLFASGEAEIIQIISPLTQFGLLSRLKSVFSATIVAGNLQEGGVRKHGGGGWGEKRSS